MWTWVTLLMMFVYVHSAAVPSKTASDALSASDHIRSKRFAHDIYNYLASYQQAHQFNTPAEEGEFLGDKGMMPQKRFSDLVNYLHMYQQEPHSPDFVDKEKKDEHDLLNSAPVGWNLLNLNSLDHE